MSVQKAIGKINTEMQKQPDDIYLEIIGHYIIDRCSDEEAASKVLSDNKTLSGAASAVEAAARKKAANNRALMKDAEIFDTVDKYFGFTRDDSARSESIQSVDGHAPAVPTRQPNAPGALCLDFESFL